MRGIYRTKLSRGSSIQARTLLGATHAFYPTSLVHRQISQKGNGLRISIHILHSGFPFGSSFIRFDTTDIFATLVAVAVVRSLLLLLLLCVFSMWRSVSYRLQQTCCCFVGHG